MNTPYTGSLHAATTAAQFDEALLAEFIVEVIRDPNNRSQHAVRLFGGNWNKASELLRYAETPEFTEMLFTAKRHMTKNDQMYSKEDFVISVQAKMATFEGELWLKTAQFYAKLQGFVSDAPLVAIQNNVIQVPAKTNDNAWESNATQRQQALQAEARVIHD